MEVLVAIDMDEVGRWLIKAAKQNRGYAAYFDFPDKRVKEEALARLLANALMEKGHIPKRQTSVISRKDDPPDCEIIVQDGERIGVEITELVDQEAIEEFKRSGDSLTNHSEWSNAKFVDRVSKIVKRKDDPHRVNGGPYDRYILLLHTDEAELNAEQVEKMAESLSINTLTIDEVWILVSYDPNRNGYPMIQISTTRL